MQWGPGRAEAARSCAQKQGNGKAKASHAVAFDLAVDLRVPVCRGEGRTEMPERSRARCARVRCLDREVQSTNPGLPSRTRSEAASAASGVHFFWLLFFGQAKKSDPRAGCARKSEGTRQQADQGRCKNWIPASAGRATTVCYASTARIAATSTSGTISARPMPRQRIRRRLPERFFLSSCIRSIS